MSEPTSPKPPGSVVELPPGGCAVDASDFIFPQYRQFGDRSIVMAGMTLRDVFAALAMHATCANSELTTMQTDALARYAYEQADAMLKARK